MGTCNPEVGKSGTDRKSEIVMQAVIIAGGLGTRLGKLTANQPKSLIPILGKPFIEYQFDFLKKGGITDIVLCLGYQGQQIAEYCGNGNKFGVNLKYSFEDKPLDTAGALKLAGPLLQNYFFSLYGDSYVFIDFKDMFDNPQKKNKMGAMSVYYNQDRFDKSNTAVGDGLVTFYSKEQRANLKYIDYGVNLFRKEVLNLIPQDKPYSMGTLFNQLIARQELLAYEVKQRFYEIGSVNGLTEFTEYVKGKI
jgi:NDP-sugar pyrophosphorylase family protein